MSSSVFSSDDQLQRQILQSARVIAVVGMSNKPVRASLQIGRFLKAVGYKIYPVNPNLSQIDGLTVYPTLADVPEPIDIVDVFRRSEFLSEVVDEAIAVKAKGVWGQLGVYDEDAAIKGRAAGLLVIMDTCIKVSYNRLLRP